MRFSVLILFGFAMAVLAARSLALADTPTIERVYDPYVYLMEREIEVRTLYQSDSNGDVNGGMLYRFAYGQSLSDRLFAELYLIAEDRHGTNFDVEDFEVELKWQLTEQGNTITIGVCCSNSKGKERMVSGRPASGFWAFTNGQIGF